LKNKIIFIALDCNLSRAKSIIKSIKNVKVKKFSFALKIGYQIFYAKGGRDFIQSLKNFDIFLDIKAHDIENTIKSAMLSIKDLKNVKYLTIHTVQVSRLSRLLKNFVGIKNY
jgi:orotidine-5'-phosphate decarboxylase